MTRIYIVPIEPIDTRYTRQWYEHIPVSLEKQAAAMGKKIDIIVVDGEQVPPVPTPGAFLDFGATNIYKSSQLGAIAAEFQHGRVKPGDQFLFTDAWNPSVISVRYMSELLNIPVKLHGMWHAGSYDSQDFLGRLIGDADWVRTAEKSMYHCYDTNWFATEFHMDMFLRDLLEVDRNDTKRDLLATSKIALTGWPMDYLVDLLEPYSKLNKRPMICFPHRLAPEKQLEIFKDLAKHMPEYEWKVCQEMPLTKHEYHTILGESTMVFSANLQETLGISSCAEAPLSHSIPLCPNRLSYSEIFEGMAEFLYPSEWTESYSSYESNKGLLIDKIKYIMTNAATVRSQIIEYNHHRFPRYFSGDALVSRLLE